MKDARPSLEGSPPPENAHCQLYDLSSMAPKLSSAVVVLQRILKLRVSLRRRRDYVAAFLRKRTKRMRSMSKTPAPTKAGELQPGDRVRVRSLDEIRATLDHWSKLKGCSFLREMEPYCGTVRTVRKRVRRFLTENDYLVKKSAGIVLLDDVFCEGTKDFGACDRSCFYFWREEWLEKLVPAPDGADRSSTRPSDERP